MRGKVLGFDAAGGTGAISGSDGRRYNFAAAQWRGEGPPTPGVYVDFDSADGSTATALFPEVKTVFTPPPTSRPPAGHPQPGGPPPQAHSSAPGPYPQPGPASGGYPQPGPAAGGYPQPGARSPYPGQQPQPGPPPRAPYPGSYAGGGPSENYPPAGGYPGQPYPEQKSKVVAGSAGAVPRRLRRAQVLPRLHDRRADPARCQRRVVRAVDRPDRPVRHDGDRYWSRWSRRSST